MSDEKWNFEMSPEIPDWEDLEHIPLVSIGTLCCLVLNVDSCAGRLILEELNRAWRQQDDFYSFYGIEKDDAEKFMVAHNRISGIIVSNLDFNHGSIEAFKGSYYEPIESTQVRLTKFVEWADSTGLPLPEGFPRGSTSKPDNAEELKKSYRVIVALLDYIDTKQGVISKEIGDKGIKGLGKREIDGVFGKAKKMLKE